MEAYLRKNITFSTTIKMDTLLCADIEVNCRVINNNNNNNNSY